MVSQNNAPILEALEKYYFNNIIPFDVPGHKHGIGNKELCEFLGKKTLEIDVNSMEELDNLNNPISVIKESEELMAELCGSKKAYFLINGTTSGIQAMILSTCKENDKILVPRNSHKSVTGALILSGAKPIYISPNYNYKYNISTTITLSKVQQAYKKHGKIKAMVVLNPSYYGIVANLQEIVDYAHKNNTIVLADEAHGTHFLFGEGLLPKSAMQTGVDMSTVSFHKTGGSLTQSSVLLINKEYNDEIDIKSVLSILQTTSASYLLMVSLDVSRRNWACNKKSIIDNMIYLSTYCRTEINKIIGLTCIGEDIIGCDGVYDYDITKIVVNVSELNLTGFQVYDILRHEFYIQSELADICNILAVITLGDTLNSINKLIAAFKSISEKYYGKCAENHIINNLPSQQEPILTPREVFFSKKISLPIDECKNKICAETVTTYPPGIPIILPGELITQSMIEYIKTLKIQKKFIINMQDTTVKSICIIQNY